MQCLLNERVNNATIFVNTIIQCLSSNIVKTIILWTSRKIVKRIILWKLRKNTCTIKRDPAQQHWPWSKFASVIVILITIKIIVITIRIIVITIKIIVITIGIIVIAIRIIAIAIRIIVINIKIIVISFFIKSICCWNGSTNSIGHDGFRTDVNFCMCYLHWTALSPFTIRSSGISRPSWVG